MPTYEAIALAEQRYNTDGFMQSFVEDVMGLLEKYYATPTVVESACIIICKQHAAKTVKEKTLAKLREG